MQVRKFNIPSFEEWNVNHRYYREKIGDFCFRCGKDTEYSFYACISIDSEGTITIFYSNLACKDDKFEIIKEWYKSIKEEANKVWEKYIIDTYFEK